MTGMDAPGTLSGSDIRAVLWGNLSSLPRIHSIQSPRTRRRSGILSITASASASSPGDP